MLVYRQFDRTSRTYTHKKWVMFIDRIMNENFNGLRQDYDYLRKDESETKKTERKIGVTRFDINRKISVVRLSSAWFEVFFFSPIWNSSYFFLVSAWFVFYVLCMCVYVCLKIAFDPIILIILSFGCFFRHQVVRIFFVRSQHTIANHG